MICDIKRKPAWASLATSLTVSRSGSSLADGGSDGHGLSFPIKVVGCTLKYTRALTGLQRARFVLYCTNPSPVLPSLGRGQAMKEVDFLMYLVAIRECGSSTDHVAVELIKRSVFLTICS